MTDPFDYEVDENAPVPQYQLDLYERTWPRANFDGTDLQWLEYCDRTMARLPALVESLEG